MKKILMTLIIIILLLAVIGGVGAYSYIKSVSAPLDPSSEEMKSIEIETGSTTRSIANVLEENGIIKSAMGFRIFSKINKLDGTFQAGTYLFSPAMSLDEITKELQSGKSKTISVTIPEGLNINETADILEKAGLIDKEKFIEAATNADFDFDFAKALPKTKTRLEGYLFPETYSFTEGQDEISIINTMLSQFDSVFTDEFRAKAKELGLTINEAVTIASIIEKEAQKDDERAKVSSVIYNRLKIDMTLGMCSTVIYSMGKHKKFLTDEDTAIDSPYNTYKNKGLPPGPIASPGAKSIEAALYPENTNYIYFVVSAKGDGSMEFSESYEEFLKNKDAYYESVQGQE